MSNEYDWKGDSLPEQDWVVDGEREAIEDPLAYRELDQHIDPFIDPNQEPRPLSKDFVRAFVQARYFSLYLSECVKSFFNGFSRGLAFEGLQTFLQGFIQLAKREKSTKKRVKNGKS